jgi:hypothetical protein
MPLEKCFEKLPTACGRDRAVSEFLRKGRTMKRKDPQEAVIGLFLFMSFSGTHHLTARYNPVFIFFHDHFLLGGYYLGKDFF